MGPTKKQTVVLYFTRSAGEEARAKTFCSSGNFGENKAIAQRLIDHTTRQIHASELPVRVFTSNLQQGRTFGEKLGNAFQSLFEQGYQNVIAVGNDCPQLSAQTLNYTNGLLQQASLVAGPARDGGTYLLGINREAFDKGRFSSLAWQTGDLLNDFEHYARALGFELCTLAPSADIDNEAGLRLFIRQVYDLETYFRLALLLLSIINSSLYSFQQQKVAFLSSYHHLSLFHRGPPCS